MSDKKNPPVIEKEEQAPFQAGEKGFAIFWLIFGLFFLWQSILIYQKNPGLSSCGAVPLFCSGVIVLCAVIIIISDRKKRTPNTGQPIAVQFRQTIVNIFPTDITLLILLMLMYCVALYMKLGFYIATPIFLWIGMTWFMRKHFLIDGNFDKAAFVKIAIKNLVWTVICILFILVMFTYLFKVVLP